MSCRFDRIGSVMLCALLLLAARAQPTPPAGTSAGINIQNQAGATYRDSDGATYETKSPVVTIIARGVAGVVVTPDDTQSSALTIPNDRITRVFRVCNAGNMPDSYVLTRAETFAPSIITALYYDLNGDGLLTSGDTPVTLNATTTPVLQPGECLSVLALVETGAVAPGSAVTIGITARSTSTTAANGAPQDTGTIINNVGAPVIVTSPDNPALPPSKLVENRDRVTSTPGSVLSYTISFRNRGAAPARNVLLADDLPAELDYLPGTLKLGNRLLTDADDSDEGRVSGRRFEIRLPLVAPDEVVFVSFQGRLNASVIPGVGVINTATISGENIKTTTRTSEAIAVISPFGTVYAGYSGGSVRIPGAQVVLATDQEGAKPLQTSSTPGFTPNAANANPFLTDQEGHFSFALTAAQVGTTDNPATYYVLVTADGYRPRLLAVTIRPASDQLYGVTIRSLDGQPIAQGGSFELTDSVVTLDHLAALVMNIPMFEAATLELSKIPDRQQVEVGEMVSYRLEAHNASSVAIKDLQITDTLPQSFSYIAGTARIQAGNSAFYAIDPLVSGSTLIFRIGQLGPGERVVIAYRVRIGVNARQGEQVNVAIASGKFPSGNAVSTRPVKAPVVVGPGVFSMRQIIIGRVFEDTNGNGLFDKGERPVAGARVYLDNGNSVLTDSQGMYNFPSVEDGARVVSLDPVTVPNGFALHDNRLKSGRSWARLLRTPLGGGALLRQNFALTKITSPLETATDLNGDGETTTGAEAIASPAAPVSPAIPTSPRAPVIKPGTEGSEPKFEDADNRTAKRKNGRKAAAKKVAAENLPVTSGALRPGGPKTRAGAMAINADRRAGVYESVATETVEPIAPGEIKLLSPEPNEVISEPALRVEARVEMSYTVALEVEGERIPETNIGVREIDRKNRIATFVYIGVVLRPGPNRLRVIPVSPAGVPGRAAELTVVAPGQAKRFVITTDRREIQSGGRESTLIRVKAYDQWNNPAQGGVVTIEVSAGRLIRLKDGKPETLRDEARLAAPALAAGIEAGSGITGEQVTATQRQQTVPLENGEAVVQLIAEGQPGNAEIRAHSGDVQAAGRVRFTPEMRPQLLVGLAEASFGKAAPDIALRDEDRSFRSHTEFYFRGPLPKRTQLTLAYNSFRPLTRTAGRDRLFQLDPLDRVYPVFGDSSTRFEDAQSNSKLYARLDRGRSFAMFGDFDVNNSESLYTQPVQPVNLSENLASSAIGNIARAPVFASGGPQLTGYSRRLTGVKVHLENAGGDYLTVTGARPDTAFAREIVAGGTLGLVRLAHTEILQGSETLILEVRDRRNPELILSRETLVRSVDYNLDAATGLIFLLRPVSTFDYALNLVQIVVMYEHRTTGLSSAVYTARGAKSLDRFGVRVGASFINQRQDQLGAYYIGGVDVEKRLPHNGTLQFEWGMSRGRVAEGSSLLTAQAGPENQEHNGSAFRAELRQPLPFAEAQVQASFIKTDQSFLNPFGGTVSPGSQRASVAVDLKPRARSQVRLGFTDERNRTATFDNSRQTISIGWVESISDKLRVSLGYDYRHFSDASGSALASAANANNKADGNTANTAAPISFAGREVTSNLLTIGAEYQPTEKLQLAVRREQNLGAPDPTYPNQTTISANYRISPLAKLFFTQRLAAGAITPIGDFGVSGFAATASRRETAIGVETTLSRYTSLSGRYQIDNGINGTDSFAVIGLINQLPIRKTLSLDLGYERGLHLAGSGQSFNNASFGLSWQPTDRFRSAARYELRDLHGFGNVFIIGAAGKIKENLTTLGRFQMAKTDLQGRRSNALSGQAALAWRPLESDRTALLFSYTHRSLEQSGVSGIAPARDRADVISADGLYQATRRLELYGRFALKFSANGRPEVPLASTLTMLYQGRAEYRFARSFDVAGESRLLWQPSGSRRSSFGAELGYWALADLRVAGGYSFTRASEPQSFMSAGFNLKRGFYFVISSKLSNFFNLFGTARQGLAGEDQSPAAPRNEEE
ncbi:MAG TPA: SdrD B-like domain-containing protein [Blastocatellia bacterium]|nr:SdrD B-like domain-containing protein [Blastocatellia bacterium]